MLKYKNKEEAISDHVKNYRSDGIEKGKGTQHASDYHRVQFIVNEVPKKAYVLDVGCNGGTVAVHLLQRGCYVKGIDVVSELVKKAIKRGVYAEVGNAEDLSKYKDNEFDCVICAEVLEHLYDPLPAIEEAYRVLKPKGKYLVTVPHPSCEMEKDGKLGDYHQQKFGVEVLDTLFHCCFKRGKVTFTEIPYTQTYCRANGVNPKRPQWLGLVAEK
jgi:2-polyprenyl-3-methyl-5-hydroxy-6-metoxy-1,4-benzoquinol methylase